MQPNLSSQNGGVWKESKSRTEKLCEDPCFSFYAKFWFQYTLQHGYISSRSFYSQGVLVSAETLFVGKTDLDIGPWYRWRRGQDVDVPWCLANVVAACRQWWREEGQHIAGLQQMTTPLELTYFFVSAYPDPDALHVIYYNDYKEASQDLRLALEAKQLVSLLLTEWVARIMWRYLPEWERLFALQ